MQLKNWGVRLDDTLSYLKATDPERYARYVAALEQLPPGEQERIGKSIGVGGSMPKDNKQLRKAARADKLRDELARAMNDKYGGTISADSKEIIEEGASWASMKLWANPEYWKRQIAAREDSGLPHLGEGEFWMAGEVDTKFNCLAHALGETAADVWPSDGEIDASGGRITKKMISALVKPRGYSSQKFDSTVSDSEIPLGTIVAFGTGPDDLKHFAKRVRGGFESKLGRACVMFHESLSQIAGKSYGQPVWLYVPNN